MKKNETTGLWYFESHDEIRRYLAQMFEPFGHHVYLTTLQNAHAIQGGVVVADTNEAGQPYVITDEDNAEVQHGPDYVYSRDYSIREAIGTIDDFPATAFAVKQPWEAVNIEAATVVEGFYQAGEHLAGRLRTVGEKRTAFTTKDLTAVKQAVVTEAVSETVYLYRITTATGYYQCHQDSLWWMTLQMEQVEGVSPSKRKVFTIQPKGQKQATVILRLAYDTDKEVQRIKNCLDKDDIRPFAQQPAIEPATGVMIGTNGHILTVHKLSGYEQDAQSGLPAYYCDVMAVPKEVCQMKGRVTIEAVEGKWEESVKKSDGSTEMIEKKGIIVTATDAQGRQGVAKQSWRYPNWRSVIPATIGPAISIDTKMLADGVKRIMPQLCGASLLMVVEADKGDKNLKLSGKDYDFSKDGSVAVELAGKMPCPMKVALKASTVVTAAGFAVSTMHFTDASRALVFLGDTTLTMQMPMDLFDYRKEPHPTDGQLRKFDLNEWVEAPLPEKPNGKPASKKVGAKAAKEATQHQPIPADAPTRSLSDIGHQPSFAEKLREALLRQFRQAA